MANSFVRLINPLMDLSGKKFSQVYGEVTVSDSKIEFGDYIVPMTNVASILNDANIDTKPNSTLIL